MCKYGTFRSMTENNFPTRLENDPIVDCIIELRFQPESDTAIDVFPGVLYSHLKDSYPKMEKTPVAQIPSSVRKIDDNLKYSATVDFVGDQGRVKVADCAIQIGINAPYPGWKLVRPRVEAVLESVMNTGLVSRYERISILYHNIIPVDEGCSALDPLELDLKIGRNIDQREQGILLRTEIAHGEGVTIVQVQSGAQAQIAIPGQPIKMVKGTHLSVDTIAVGDIENFEQMRERLELVHSVERNIFFRMVKEDAWQKLEPIWEK